MFRKKMVYNYKTNIINIYMIFNFFDINNFISIFFYYVCYVRKLHLHCKEHFYKDF